MKSMLTYYNKDRGLKIKVIPHSWAKNVAVLLLYKVKRFLFIRTWEFVEDQSVMWPEHRGIMDQHANELFNKYGTRIHK